MKKIFLITFLITTFVFASDPKKLNTQAINLIQSSKKSEAYILLEKAFLDGNYDNQTLFILGSIAKENGDLKNATKYFELLLKADNSAQRVRLELAAVYFKLGKLKKAKKLLLEVKASHPPKKVGDNIDIFLATIDKGVSKAWAVGISIGRMYDSNANAGPGVDTVLIYNLPFHLSPDAQRSADYATKYNINFNTINKFDNFAWQNTFNVNIVDYSALDALDSKNISFSSALTKRVKRVTYSLPFIANTLIIGHSKRYYYTNIGIAPQISYQYNKRTALYASLSLHSRKYYKAPNRKSNGFIFTPSIRFFINQSSYFSSSLYVGEETSKTEIYGNHSRGLNLSYYKAFNQSLSTYISFNRSKTNYKGVEIAYNQSRNDISRTVSGTLSYLIKPINSTLSFNMSRTNNSSNISMYTYKRNQIGLDISTNF